MTDRPGHDRRYALRGDKIARDTGFAPEVSFETVSPGPSAGTRTMRVDRRVKSGEYRDYYQTNYAWRDERELMTP